MDKEKEGSEEFGHVIKEMRTKHGLTLAQVAERLDISTNYVSQLERGKRPPTDELIKEFSSLYRVNEDKLYRLSGRIPLSALEEMKKTPSLQKALSFLKTSKVSEERRKELENELLDVFAEFLDIHKDELMDDEIAEELLSDEEIDVMKKNSSKEDKR